LGGALKACISARKIINIVSGFLEKKKRSYYEDILEDEEYLTIIEHICLHSSNDLLRVDNNDNAAYPEFSDDVIEAFIAEANILYKKIEALIAMINEFKTLHPQQFNPPTSKCIEAFRNYLSVASYITKDPFISLMQQKMKELNVITGNCPSSFVFICAPSGSGKTNCAFAFQIPSLYLLNENVYVSSSQPIYGCFDQQSQYFWSLIAEDLIDYLRTNPEIMIGKQILFRRQIQEMKMIRIFGMQQNHQILITPKTSSHS
jgi:hypothetical protein